jgi:DNA-directed RNA polymerase subunit RPC12/RpoP
VTRVACPECGHTGAFDLGTDGDLRCSECGREFDPHAAENEERDSNAPPNTHGLESDVVDPDGDEPGAFWCPDCGARVTRSPIDPNIEYGHRAGHAPDKNDGERCPRRPASVDTQDGRVKSALSMHESMGIGRFAAREESEEEEGSA